MGDFSAFATSALVYLVVVTIILLLIYKGLGNGMRSMRYSSRNIRTTSLTVLFIIVGWLIVTTAISSLYKLSPTVLGVLVLVAFMGVWYVYKSRKLNQVIQKMPKGALVNIHFLRVFTELLLWFMFTDVGRWIPKQLTVEGYNFDIIIALSAPFIAYRCFKARSWPKSYAVVWNVVGILMILNMYVLIALTSESSVRIFVNETLSSRVFNNFPFVWMPTFTMPLFILLHLLSIKQIKTPVEKEDFIIRKRKREGKIFEN